MSSYNQAYPLVLCASLPPVPPLPLLPPAHTRAVPGGRGGAGPGAAPRQPASVACAEPGAPAAGAARPAAGVWGHEWDRWGCQAGREVGRGVAVIGMLGTAVKVQNAESRAPLPLPGLCSWPSTGSTWPRRRPRRRRRRGIPTPLCSSAPRRPSCQARALPLHCAPVVCTPAHSFLQKKATFAHLLTLTPLQACCQSSWRPCRAWCQRRRRRLGGAAVAARPTALRCSTASALSSSSPTCFRSCPRGALCTRCWKTVRCWSRPTCRRSTPPTTHGDSCLCRRAG